MKDSPKTPRMIGWLLLILGIAVFAVRLQHPGSYAIPRGGNLAGGALAIAIGALLATGWLRGSLRWLAYLSIPLVFYLAAYATMSELEEVVILRVKHESGMTTDLRLWVADYDGAEWVTMQQKKANSNELDSTRAQLLRRGELRCVMTSRHEDREAVTRVHRLRHEKYAVQRFATKVGLFGTDPSETTVALRLDPCPTDNVGGA